MDKSKLPTRTIGPTSADLLNKLKHVDSGVFCVEDALKVYDGTKGGLLKLLYDLVKRGILERIKPGVFLILKLGETNSQLSSWPIIAEKLMQSNKDYIAYWSAMRLHGMTMHPQLKVYIVTDKQLKKKKIANIEYQFICNQPKKNLGVVKHWVNKHNQTTVSDLEKTILDALDRPELCGGVEEIAKGIWIKQKKIDWHRLSVYAKQFHSKAAVKRLGFLLEVLAIENESVDSLQAIIINSHDYNLLDPSASRSGKFMQRWRVQINVNIESLKAGVWS